mgnify:CR=1 FL=1
MTVTELVPKISILRQVYHPSQNFKNVDKKITNMSIVLVASSGCYKKIKKIKNVLLYFRGEGSCISIILDQF